MTLQYSEPGGLSNNRAARFVRTIRGHYNKVTRESQEVVR